MGVANRASWYEKAINLRRAMERHGYVDDSKAMVRSVLNAASSQVAHRNVEVWRERYEYAVSVQPEESGFNRPMPVKNGRIGGKPV